MLYINPKFTANSFATHPMYEGKTKERNGKEMQRKESLELEFLSPYIGQMYIVREANVRRNNGLGKIDVLTKSSFKATHQNTKENHISSDEEARE